MDLELVELEQGHPVGGGLDGPERRAFGPLGGGVVAVTPSVAGGVVAVAPSVPSASLSPSRLRSLVASSASPSMPV
jgi:hypothetical protein